MTPFIYFKFEKNLKNENIFFRNHLVNLCNNETDFGIKVESCNFFATSHGKNACDGIGAAGKRKARTASLQGAHITSAEQMYKYLKENDSSIRYKYYIFRSLSTLA